MNTVKKLIALFISMLMCFCMCACGGEGSVEETVEITEPAAAPADGEDKNDDGDKNGAEVKWKPDSQDEAKVKAGKPDKKAGSPYKSIYRDCNIAMRDATSKYVGQLKDKASSISKNELYDETQGKIEELKKIYDKHKDIMVDTMLKSTEDDDEDYKKYFAKMTEKYSEYTREITSVYTEQF